MHDAAQHGGDAGDAGGLAVAGDAARAEQGAQPLVHALALALQLAQHLQAVAGAVEVALAAGAGGLQVAQAGGGQVVVAGQLGAALVGVRRAHAGLGLGRLRLADGRLGAVEAGAERLQRLLLRGQPGADAVGAPGRLRQAALVVARRAVEAVQFRVGLVADAAQPGQPPRGRVEASCAASASAGGGRGVRRQRRPPLRVGLLPRRVETLAQRRDVGAELRHARLQQAVALARQIPLRFQVAHGRRQPAALGLGVLEALAGGLQVAAPALHLRLGPRRGGLGRLPIGGAIARGGAALRQGRVQAALLAAVEVAEGGVQFGGQLGVLDGALGLPLDGAQARLDLGRQQAGAGQVLLGLGAAAAAVDHAQTMRAHAGHVLDQAAAILGTQPQHLLDQPLPHERVRARPQPALREQLLDVAQAHARVVDAELRLAAAVHAPHDLDLGRVERQPAGAVVEHDAGLGQPGRGAAARAGEDHVLHALGPHQAARRAADDPAQRVHDVRLARAVRPHDGGDAGVDLELRARGEGLVALDLESLEVHARSRSSAAGRGAAAARAGEPAQGTASAGSARRAISAAAISAACLLGPAPPPSVSPLTRTSTRNSRSWAGPRSSTVW